MRARPLLRPERRCMGEKQKNGHVKMDSVGVEPTTSCNLSAKHARYQLCQKPIIILVVHSFKSK